MTILEKPKHVARQTAVAEKLAQAWNAEYGSFGQYAPIDVYFMRNKNIVSMAEIRTRRDRECNTFGTVLIDLDKWFHLMQAEIGLAMPAMYVVTFTDGIWYVRIGTLAVNNFKIKYRGRTDRPEAPNDMSPVIEVPSSMFVRVCGSDGVFEE